MSALGQKRTLTTCPVGPLLRASGTFPGLPLLRISRNVVRARITKAPIACQNNASMVAVFERAILAVPIHTTGTQVDHPAPGILRFCWLSTDEHTSKSSDSSKNHAGHRGLHISML